MKEELYVYAQRLRGVDYDNIDEAHELMMERKQMWLRFWSTEVSKQEFRLSTLEVPTFDGYFRKWPNFAEAFKPLVLDNGARPLECLFRLKSALTGVPGGMSDQAVM